jgi:hypothetical protein
VQRYVASPLYLSFPLFILCSFLSVFVTTPSLSLLPLSSLSPLLFIPSPSLPLHFLLSDDDYENTEGVNVYKLSRTEYLWAMLNAGSISECWEILKDGEERNYNTPRKIS